jgi:hypothetical protein
MRNKKTEFWISNLSDKNVCLRDLALTIKARTNVNLLDSKHYSFNLEQLEKSAENGSLHAKSHLLRVRKVPPPEPLKTGLHISRKPLFMSQNPLFSKVVIEEPKYEELEMSETEFIDELTNED